MENFRATPGPGDADPTTPIISDLAEQLMGSPGTVPVIPEVTPGLAPAELSGLTLPDDIGTLLDIFLDPADMPGPDTKKFTIEGHPDLLVRLNPGETYENRVQAKRALAQLSGVNAVPFEVIPRHGEAYVVTKMVDGVSLEEALASNPSETLLHAVDQNWKSLTEGLVRAKLEDSDWVEDIDTFNQYMVGTVRGDTVPRLWMVDAPQYTIRPQEVTVYESQLLYLANGVNEVEALTGRKLAAARRAIYEALRYVEDIPQCGDGMEHAIVHVLQHKGSTISPLDNWEYLNSLRTR